ncbi:hypothetical protein QFW96_00440 [Saccharopolyspora sp. TS4A08]|uniref:Ig-like domain-containing protein n=1 Tax=Saccharopolyspora ipomoeae TaxID=3042027 RepID=A0ABT6PGC3_9PSEU|nr:hypothetical protein [Saccharopolyspora sp. TS4A08]MDI2027050.1 hypothetical protein [Saccharopolyspora sp. TS4A08]
MLSQFTKKSAITGAAAALVAAPLLGALTAQAAPSPAPEDAKAVLSCDLSGTAEFAPALSANPLGEQTQMKVSGDAKNCAPAGREAADVESATFSGDLAGTMSCTSLPRDVNGDVDITWKLKDGSTETSKANFALNMEGDLTNPGQPVTGAFEGETTDGEFADAKHKGTGKFDMASAAGGCLAGGLSTLDFAGEYELSK